MITFICFLTVSSGPIEASTSSSGLISTEATVATKTEVEARRPSPSPKNEDTRPFDSSSSTNAALSTAPRGIFFFSTV